MSTATGFTPRRKALLLVMMSAFSAAPAWAAPGDPLGPAFSVNAFNPRQQFYTESAVARDGLGNFVVLWHSAFLPITGLRFAADGTPIGTPFTVDSAGGTDLQIAMDSSGDFAVSWISPSGLMARAFELDGSPRGAATLVTANGRDNHSGIAIDEDGDFIIVWDVQRATGGTIPIIGYFGIPIPEVGIQTVNARRFGADGQPVGSQIVVSTDLLPLRGPHIAAGPSVATDSNGNFAVAWEASSSTGGTGAYAQRYTSTGKKTGSKLRVDPADDLASHAPGIAMGGDGAFTVVWTSEHPTGPNSSSGLDVYARHFSASNLAGAATKISNDVNIDLRARIAMNPSGQAVATWAGAAGNFCCTPRQISAQIFSPDGSLLGLNHTITDGGSEVDSKVGLDADGNYVLVWDRPSDLSTRVQLFSGR